MTPNYYDWAVKYLDNATIDMNAHETINYLREVSHYGAKGRKRLNTDIHFFVTNVFDNHHQDILQALLTIPNAGIMMATWKDDFKEEAVCYVFEIVAGIMADELEEALKN
ncbi:hypothetical protein 000TH008_264 [Bacillus phage 000TH008]|nr:hypothetical protein 000TH008_6 [Bacillus phage 000TH008]QQO40692.1 hypothetical protein 000TH008_264 [Bacillus phage 000TH008]QQO40700.1 hypothetical protein 000TH009_6 [Bacillus phage 000TH009]QQO40957.1 hypothetical protein 000TH009_264 [Bacillus phage 000TH009]